jgi:hypothetical protein
MLTALFVVLRSLALICRGHRAVALKNLALRQQLAVLRRTVTHPPVARHNPTMSEKIWAWAVGMGRSKPSCYNGDHARPARSHAPLAPRSLPFAT